MEEMMGGAEKFKNKSKAIILKFHPHYVTKRDQSGCHYKSDP
jgi:hypothetical protein